MVLAIRGNSVFITHSTCKGITLDQLLIAMGKKANN